MTRITQRDFGTVNGQTVVETTMTNECGMQLATCTYGATITTITAPDKDGHFANVVCSFPSVEGYVTQPQFFGATIGPFAGRLENSEVATSENVVKVPPNEGKHLLHGGRDGFHQALWDVSIDEKTLSTTYTYVHNSAYPGEISMTVTFTLTEANEVVINYEGSASEHTLLNCTNHSYFNLSGNLQRPVHDHILTLPAEKYIPINEEGLPVGTYETVANTVFDCRDGRPLRTVIEASHPQISYASGGFDHPFLIDEGVLTLFDPKSGRRLTIETTEPCVVVYTGNKIGSGYHFREAPAQDFLGICLEEQNVPNSSRYPHFPSSLLKKGMRYEKQTVYRFDA